MVEQIRAHTWDAYDSHARFHDRDWLTVVDNDWLPESGKRYRTDGVRTLLCHCDCGNEVYVLSDTVYRRREKR